MDPASADRCSRRGQAALMGFRAQPWAHEGVRIPGENLTGPGRGHNLVATAMPIPVDSKAPDFTLKTMGPNGLEDFQLSSNFGVQATVLLFFPLAFTGVCTQEFCDLTAGLKRYADLNADVVGISVDSPFAQDAWAKREKITIRLVSDLNKEVTRAYDVLFPGLAGIGDTAARAAFVIGKDGVVYYSEQTPTPKELPDFDRVAEVLKSLSL